MDFTTTENDLLFAGLILMVWDAIRFNNSSEKAKNEKQMTCFVPSSHVCSVLFDEVKKIYGKAVIKDLMIIMF